MYNTNKKRRERRERERIEDLHFVLCPFQLSSILIVSNSKDEQIISLSFLEERAIISDNKSIDELIRYIVNTVIRHLSLILFVDARRIFDDDERERFLRSFVNEF